MTIADFADKHFAWLVVLCIVALAIWNAKK